jgi:DNA modification methylase
MPPNMQPYYQERHATLYQGDCRATLAQLPEASVHCVVTSPPYWGLRDYGLGADALGLEPTPDLYVQHLVEIFRLVKRVLRDDGTLWLNLGDAYSSTTKGDNRPDAQQRPRDPHGFHSGSGTRWHTGTWEVQTGLKPKDLCGMPWRVAFALQADGWYLRSDIIWHKPNPMPESVRDRPTKSHEYLFLLSKSARYFYDQEAVKEPQHGAMQRRGAVCTLARSRATGRQDGGRVWQDTGFRNRRSVWTIATQPTKHAHFATFPPRLVEPCILAGCPADGTVLDPFAGAGTTLLVAKRHGRHGLGIELNPTYCELAAARLAATRVEEAA